MPAATAAVVALVIGGAAIAQHGGGSHASRPGASPTASGGSGIVPWADLPPTHPKIPVRVVGGVSRTQLAAAPRCGAGDLTAGRSEEDGAMGTTYLSVALRLVGTRPCRIDAGYPRVVLADASGVAIPVRRSPTDMGNHGPRLVLVTRRYPADVTVAWAAGHDCRNVDNTGISWAVGSFRFHTVGFGRTTCNPGEGHDGAAPSVLPVSPGYHSHQVSAYDGVDASGPHTLSARPGATVHFTVTLTSRHDLVLAPCPDYRVDAFTAPGKSANVTGQHALNCAAIPYRTSRGAPYLPAGVAVRFAMELTAPTVDAPKFLWELQTPPTFPAVGGSLTVSGQQPRGTLTGLVTIDGGPLGASSTKVTSGTVTVIGDDGGRKVVQIAADATYTATVPAGAYTLVVRTPQWNAGAPFKDRAGVTGGRVNTADLSLPRR